MKTNTSKTYRRPASLTDKKTHYCPGCGHGTVHKILAEVIDELGIRDKTLGIAPVGCAVLAYFYLDCDITEAAHGRVAAVATGMKRSLPDRLIFGYQGDGDLAAIGMAETIHAANRGENITIIFVNNTVYGMTGGQMAPTTLVGQRTATCPNGREPSLTGRPIRMCELLNTLDMPYHIERVAIDGVKGILRAKKALLTAFTAQMNDKGYSFIEILTGCPPYFRLSPADALRVVSNQMTNQFPVRVFRKEGEPINA